MLSLVWSKRISDESFVLQMFDQETGHGFLTCYNGQETNHITTGLRRNTAYKFRLQAANEEGRSVWSEEVSFQTMPDKPSPPLRPASKGRIHTNSFKVRWDPPQDNGGATIDSYHVELNDPMVGAWRTVYQGSDMDCVCDQLLPGVQYAIRVACSSTAGSSNFSEVCPITTEPVCPGQCPPPRVHGKPKASSLQLKWGWPETDGGAAVSMFEIDMTTSDNETKNVYK